jgi:hypothetical protein
MEHPLDRITTSRSRLRGIFWLPANLILIGETLVLYAREPQEGDAAEYAEKYIWLQWHLWLMMVCGLLTMVLLYYLQYDIRVVLSLAGAMYGLTCFGVSLQTSDESFGEGKYLMHLVLAPITGVIFALLTHAAALWLNNPVVGFVIVFLAFNAIMAIGSVKTWLLPITRL